VRRRHVRPPPAWQVADEQRVRDTIASIASEAIGRRPDWRLVGVRRRGLPIATLVAEAMRRIDGSERVVAEVELKRYDEDLNVLYRQPHIAAGPLPFDPVGSSVLVIDDVLFSGRTMLRAAAHLLDAGAARVECAVLCARGGREAPIAARYVGMRFDVGEDHVIEVHTPPYEAELCVRIRKLVAQP
jgi:pyrimidine operon attenuation protein / uracil phosphoribosyltransferase